VKLRLNSFEFVSNFWLSINEKDGSLRFLADFLQLIILLITEQIREELFWLFLIKFS